jgi:hypothetical protein
MTALVLIAVSSYNSYSERCVWSGLVVDSVSALCHCVLRLRLRLLNGRYGYIWLAVSSDGDGLSRVAAAVADLPEEWRGVLSLSPKAAAPIPVPVST